ncbi:MAG: hypothetical protein D6781_04570 [Verrucomicrobia bacterium]|nr:MAG: hypothetical protein D6781_04570 [Verrucomicrobiota bacterium]
MTTRHLLGLGVMLLGIVAAVWPATFGMLTGSAANSTDVFAAIEQRVRGGMLLGLGLALIAIDHLRPWSISLPAAVFWFVTGALLARLLGLILDGAVPKQWVLVSVETGIMTVAALWLAYKLTHTA